MQRLAERPLVSRRQFHEQIMRMLAIVNRLAAAQLAARQQIRIAASIDRPRLEADHCRETGGGRFQSGARADAITQLMLPACFVPARDRCRGGIAERRCRAS
jgi:hypothetical protein